MSARLDNLPADIRESTAAALRQRRTKLIRDLVNSLSTEQGLDSVNLTDFASILLTTLGTAVKNGWVDARTAAMPDLSRFSPPVTLRQLIRSIHHAERMALGELSLEGTIGANPESWQIASGGISAAAIEISAVIAESHGAVNALRDHLTTLMSPALFEFVLGQELVRAVRHGHGVALILFDLDNLSVLNRTHGRGAGERAQMNGGNRLERVALLPTSVTIPGAATLLGVSTREIIRALRKGELRAARRGRHLHIERETIDEFRRRS